MTCSMSPVNHTPHQFTCTYLKHPYIAKISVSVVFRHPLRRSLIGYTTTDAKYAQRILICECQLFLQCI